MCWTNFKELFCSAQSEENWWRIRNGIVSRRPATGIGTKWNMTTGNGLRRMQIQHRQWWLTFLKMRCQYRVHQWRPRSTIVESGSVPGLLFMNYSRVSKSTDYAKLIILVWATGSENLYNYWLTYINYNHYFDCLINHNILLVNGHIKKQWSFWTVCTCQCGQCQYKKAVGFNHLENTRRTSKFWSPVCIFQVVVSLSIPIWARLWIYYMSKLLNTSQFIYTRNSRHHTKPQALGKTFGYKGIGLRREAASQHHRVTVITYRNIIVNLVSFVSTGTFNHVFPSLPMHTLLSAKFIRTITLPAFIP
jgi:hypothetical protein